MRRASWLLVAAAVFSGGCDQPAPSAQLVRCPDPAAGCRFEVGGEALALRFSESPRPMRAFVLEVDAPRAAAVAADFTMSGMDMLPNRYDLARKPDGHWRATVVLPVCVSGRQDWSLALTVDEQRASVPFSAGK